MVQINPLVLMLLTEAVGILVIALAVVGILGLRRIARDKRGIRGLISNANSQAAVRKETLSGVITAREGLEGDALEARVGEILAAERLFLQNFIRVYRRRNAAEVSKMCAAVSGLVAPYLSVEVAVAATSSVVPPVGAAAPETNDYSPAGANGEGLVDCGGAPADTEAPGMIDDLIMVADDDAMQDRLALPITHKSQSA